MERVLSSDRPDHTWFLPENVDPDWQARRDLADALRALSEACVGTQADRKNLQAATSLVRDATQLLPDGRTAAQAFTDGSYMDNPGLWIDRGALM
ncbi:MAG: hypothetical protein QGG40_22630, partial [Myxococcota bacterium]|nr:hypothetical protein [Myxococcota bacterium]